mmetsp:Transcript_39635/g.84527  ORF Transcript_39635/g.84527 Transcript_39635/m.84527 type:complete len:205 (+) Transcript_39635:84-698(+)
MRGYPRQRGPRILPELEADDVVAAVEHDDGDEAVWAEEGDCLKAILARASAVLPHVPGVGRCGCHLGSKMLGARRDVLREMPDVMILRVLEERPLRHICHNSCIAHIVRMVRAPCLIEEEVPIDPTHGARIEVADDVMSVSLAESPLPALQGSSHTPAIALVSGLTREQHGLREVSVDTGHFIESVARIPMKGDSGRVLSRGRV